MSDQHQNLVANEEPSRNDNDREDGEIDFYSQQLQHEKDREEAGTDDGEPALEKTVVEAPTSRARRRSLLRQSSSSYSLLKTGNENGDKSQNGSLVESIQQEHQQLLVSSREDNKEDIIDSSTGSDERERTRLQEGIRIEEEDAADEEAVLTKPFFQTSDDSLTKVGWHPQKDEKPEGSCEVLPPDTFSMLMTSRAFSSSSFYFALGIFLFQIAVMVLLFLNMAEVEDNKPFLDPPASVSIPVRISQYLSVPISIAMQDDVLVSITSMTDYNLWNFFRRGRKGLFIFSNLCRLGIGLLGLFLSMIIIIQSVSVLDLFKDFAALAFISLIDNVAFYMASQGFFSFYLCCETYSFVSLQKEAERIKSMKVPNSTDMYHGKASKTHKCQKMMRPTIVLVLFVIMTSCLGLVTKNQITAKYLPKSIYVDMGDDEVYWISYNNGIYDMLFENESVFPLKYNGRVVYKERLREEQQADYVGFLYYSDMLEHWAFGLFSDFVDDETLPTDFDNAQMIYSMTDLTEDDRAEYDITKVSSVGWKIFQGGQFVSMKEMNIITMTCYNNGDCNSNGDEDDASASGKGYCDAQTKRCICQSSKSMINEAVVASSSSSMSLIPLMKNSSSITGFNMSGDYFFGSHCQYRGPCRQIGFKDLRYKFHSSHHVTTFDILSENDSALMPFGQPVYYNGNNFIVFGGRRWFLLRLTEEASSKADDEEQDLNYQKERLSAYVRQLHLTQNEYNLKDGLLDKCEYMSESTSSRSGGTGSGSPHGLSWYRWLGEDIDANVLTSVKETNIVTLCSDCTFYSDPDNDGPACMYGGTCRQRTTGSYDDDILGGIGTCECENGYHGQRCQHPPVLGSIQETIRISVAVDEENSSMRNNQTESRPNVLSSPANQKRPEPDKATTTVINSPWSLSSFSGHETKRTESNQCFTLPEIEFSLDESSKGDEHYYWYYEEQSFNYSYMDVGQQEQKHLLQISWTNQTLQVSQVLATTSNGEEKDTTTEEETHLLDVFSLAQSGNFGELQKTYHFQNSIGSRDSDIVSKVSSDGGELDCDFHVFVDETSDLNKDMFVSLLHDDTATDMGTNGSNSNNVSYIVESMVTIQAIVRAK